MKILGVDIGTSLIKVIELQPSSKGPQVTNYFEHRLSSAANADHSLETIEFMRGLLENYDPINTKVSFGLRQDRVAIRHKFFPFSDRLKIHKSLPFELEEDIPFSPENAVFDAKIIKYLGEGAEVLACAAPKTQVEKALQLSQDCGFQATLLSDEGLAFANIIENWSEAPPTQHAPLLSESSEDSAGRAEINVEVILNIGHTRTLVCVFEKNRLIAVRSILWGGKNIADALARKYNIPSFEAIKELEGKAFILTNKTGASFDQVSFSDTISASVRELLRDLQLTLMEVKSEFNARLTSVKLTGGASQIKNLGPFMTQTLEVPVNILDTLQHFPNPLIGKDLITLSKVGTALGLALEGLKKPRNPAINFLRGEFAPKNHSWQNFVEKWSDSFKYAGIAFLVLLSYAYLRESVSITLAEKGSETLRNQARIVAGLKGRAASEAGIQRYIQDKKKVAADLKAIEGLANMNSAMDVLLKVSNAMPSRNAIKLEVKEIYIKDDKVNLHGYVTSPRELSILEQALSSVSASGKVEKLTNKLVSKTDKVAFSFDFEMDREIQRGN